MVIVIVMEQRGSFAAPMILALAGSASGVEFAGSAGALKT
jgi:hypothetical protein